MGASISTSIAAQPGATSTLLITGIGTNFTGSPIQASAGSITFQNVISPTQITIVFSATGFVGPTPSVTFTDTGSGAQCTVLIQRLPIIELIRQNLVAAVQQISNAYPSNYLTSPVVQELAAANSDVDQLIIVGMGDSELVKPPVQKVYWKQTFWAICYAMGNDDAVGSAAAMDPRLVFLFADVFRAVYVDRTRGGLAYDTVVQPPLFESNAAEAQFRVSVPIHVFYQTLEDDPTSQG